MAVVERIEKNIEAHQYVYDSIAYVLSPEDKHKNEKCFQATCLNCEGNAEELSKQFYLTRSVFGKDSKILAHHYVQSFSPNDNITPELAHQIGIELAKKVAPGFQVIVATHIDKNHIHNHFIINSVNLASGLKWRGDETTLSHMRNESDILCRQNNFDVITNKSGLKGLDMATIKLAEKGKSFKGDILPHLIEVEASRSSTAACTVSTSYPRVSHGSCFDFMPMLFSYLHFVCLLQHLHLCHDVFDNTDKSTLSRTSFWYRDSDIRKHCKAVNLQRTCQFLQVFFRVLPVYI